MKTYILRVILCGLASSAMATEEAKISTLSERLTAAHGVTARRLAAESLGRYGPASAPAIPALTKALATDPDPAVRHFAAAALGKIGARSAVTVPALTAALQDPEWTVRHNASVSLTAIGKEAVPCLQKTLKDKNPRLRMHAGRLLILLDPSQAPAAVSVLTALLEDQTEELTHEAILSLGTAGAAAAPAVPSLVRLLDHPQPELRHQVIQTLAQTGPAAAGAAIPALIKALQQDKEKWNRIAAALALGSLGRDHPEAATALINALQDKDSRIRAYSVDALARLGKPALPLLQQTLRSPDPRLRKHAAAALGGMPQQAEPAVESLASLLADPDPVVRAAAIDALGFIGSCSSAPVTQFLENGRKLEPPESILQARYQQALTKICQSP